MCHAALPLSNISLSPLALFQQADIVVKAVLIILLLASFATWVAWLMKVLELKKQGRLVVRSMLAIEQLNHLADRIDLPNGATQTMHHISAKEFQLAQSAGLQDENTVKERVISLTDRIISNEKHRLSHGTAILATTGAIAPFVGLFGTVWGIMHSFVAIAQSNVTNLSVVAPGIAEALFATALGLFAAIPAVIFYNHVVRLITQYGLLIEDTMALLMVLLSRDLDQLAAQQRQRPQGDD